MEPDGPDRLADLVAKARRITVLTGAGVSTECGVPDFRSPDSPWRKYPPIGFADFMASAATRAEAWRRKFTMDDIYRHARPGRCHAALVALDRAGLLEAVITQNIDGLHASAGLPPGRLVEIHGNGTFARCLGCGMRHELASVRAHLDATGEALDCSCGGPVKSASIAFGQKLDTAVLARAVTASERCDLFIAVGSTLVVRPAATLPLVAKARGATLVIVNREPTPLDREADHVIRCDAGDALARAAVVHEAAARLLVHTP